MIVISGLPGYYGTSYIINFDTVQSVGAGEKPTLDLYDAIAGSHAVSCYYSAEDSDVIYIGSMDECVIELDNLIESCKCGVMIHIVRKAAPMVDPEEFK